jgi:hypothetical protein
VYDGQCYEGGAVNAALAACADMKPLTYVTSASVVREVSCTNATALGTGSATMVLADCPSGAIAGCAGASRVAYYRACDTLTFSAGPWPWALSTTDGGIVATAMVAVYIAAWCWKAIRRSLSDQGEEA